MIYKREQIGHRRLLIELIIVDEKVYYKNEETGAIHYELHHAVYGGNREYGVSGMRVVPQEAIELANFDVLDQEKQALWKDIGAKIYDIVRRMRSDSESF